MDPRRRHGLVAVTLALTLLSPAVASEDGERQLPASGLSQLSGSVARARVPAAYRGSARIDCPTAY